MWGEKEKKQSYQIQEKKVKFQNKTGIHEVTFFFLMCVK